MSDELRWNPEAGRQDVAIDSVIHSLQRVGSSLSEELVVLEVVHYTASWPGEAPERSLGRVVAKLVHLSPRDFAAVLGRSNDGETLHRTLGLQASEQVVDRCRGPPGVEVGIRGLLRLLDLGDRVSMNLKI